MSLELEVDSGACMSVLHVSDFKKYFANLEVNPVTYNLKVVTGENVELVGEVNVNVYYKNKYFYLPIVLLNCSQRFKPLLGRNWLNVLCSNWKNLFSLGSRSEETAREATQVKSVSRSQSVIESQDVSQIKKHSQSQNTSAGW